MTDEASTSAAELGLDPAGYRYPRDTGDIVPWGAPASTIMADSDEGDHEDPGYTVLDHLTDLAGAEGVGLVEYLGYRGIGPDAEPHEGLYEE